MRLALLAFVLAGALVSAPAAAAPRPGTADDLEARAREYSRGRYALFFARQAVGFATLALLLAIGLSARLRDAAESVASRPWAVVAVYWVLFLLVTSLLAFPLQLYGGFLRERRFDFARQSLAGWMGDWAKGLLVGAVLGGALVVAIYAVLRRFPRRAWLIASAVAIAFLVFSMVIAPVVLAPMFNRFRPLPSSPLKSRILDLARRQGVPAREVYEVDASRQSAHTNAYVSGLLGTRRIVLYDTLLSRDTPDEIVTVVGHELGHAVLHHIPNGIAFGSALILLLAAVTQRLFSRIAAGGRFGIRGLADPAGLPLIILIASVLGFLLSPALNGFSRRQEHAADAFALESTRDPDAFVSALMKFHTLDLSEMDPPPAIEWWLYTHPSLAHRIEFCRVWKREHGR